MKRTNDKPMRELLQDFLEVNRLKPQLTVTKIKDIWKNRMGNTVAEQTHEIRLNRKILYLYITSSSLRQELSMKRDLVKNMLNEALGEEAVDEVVIR
jgi:hypothetical protein